MFSVPITVVLGLLTAFVVGWVQRRQWYRNTREEIRVRETGEATKLITDIAQVVDKRISAQRRLAHRAKLEDGEKVLEKYQEAITAYDAEFNSLRARLLFYFNYSDVLNFERTIHNKLVSNGRQVEALYNLSAGAVSQRVVLDGLSIISAKTYRYCAKLSAIVAAERIGSLEKIEQWADPNNQYVSVGSLARRLLNI